MPLQQAKNSSEPFPCMNCGCGCLNAEMCWRECCCYSTEEKLAWARENGVTPPAFLVVLANEEKHEHDADRADCCENDELDAEELAHLKPCCRARILAQRQAAQQCHESDSCCDHLQHKSTQHSVPGVLAFQALKCQGLSLTVSLLPPCVPFADELALDTLGVSTGRLVLFDQSYVGASDAPDVPPPRCCA